MAGEEQQEPLKLAEQLQIGGILFSVATKLAKAAHKELDEAMPGRLAGVVRTHAAAGVASSFIPIPGVAAATNFAAVWSMYYRINRVLQIPLKKNMVKAIAAAICTDMASTAVSFGLALSFGELLKFIPGVGGVAGGIAESAGLYAALLAAGYIYMKILTDLLKAKSVDDIDHLSEADLKSVASQVIGDKEDIQSFAEKARRSY